jgi:hypothetical protein
MKVPADESSKDSNRFQIPWYLVINSEICGLCGSPEPGSDHFAPVAEKQGIPDGMAMKLYRVPLCGACAATLKGNPEERIRRTPELARFIQEYSNLERTRFSPEKGRWRLKY